MNDTRVRSQSVAFELLLLAVSMCCQFSAKLTRIVQSAKALPRRTVPTIYKMNEPFRNYTTYFCC